MRIRVDCTDQAHGDRRVYVHEFTWIGGMGWTTAPATRHDGSEVAPGDVWRDGELRARFDLRCKLCGLTLTARHDTLAPLLDRLAAVGVSVVELAHLARIVS